MSFKEKLIAVGAGAVLTTIVASIFLVAFIYLLIAEPLRSTILSDKSMDSLLASVLILFALDAAILFFLPPLITSIIYERKYPKSKSKDIFVICISSSVLTIFIVFILLHFLSTKGLGSVFTTQQAFISCPIIFLFWIILSGFVGPVVIWIKRTLFKNQ